MLDVMPEGMLDRWIAFDRLEPVGNERLISVLRRGLVAIARSLGSNVKEELLDPVLKRRKTPSPNQRQTPQEQRAILRHVVSMHNSSVR